MVIWITGLSGSGKTALSEVLYRRLKPSLPELVRIDGDAVRAIMGHDLGYTEADRLTQVRRMQGLAKYLSDQGLVVIAAVLYSHPELLRWNRRSFRSYFEVYLKVSLEVLRKRNAKGIYAKAQKGEMTQVVGVDIPWHSPLCPDLVIDNNDSVSLEQLAEKVIVSIPWLQGVSKGQ